MKKVEISIVVEARKTMDFQYEEGKRLHNYESQLCDHIRGLIDKIPEEVKKELDFIITEIHAKVR